MGALFLTSCQKDEKKPAQTSSERSPEIEGMCITKGTAASKALAQKLSTQLKVAMKTEGPMAAVGVCQQVAQPLSESTSSELAGLTVSRTSLKYRNPKNAPDDLDRATLESWQKLQEQGQPLPAQEVVFTDGDAALFYLPIITQEICLRCHGASESFEPKLLGLIDQLYPEDKARGYIEGELRGAFRVKIDLNSLESN